MNILPDGVIFNDGYCLIYVIGEISISQVHDGYVWTKPNCQRMIDGNICHTEPAPLPQALLKLWSRMEKRNGKKTGTRLHGRLTVV